MTGLTTVELVGRCWCWWRHMQHFVPAQVDSHSFCSVSCFLHQHIESVNSSIHIIYYMYKYKYIYIVPHSTNRHAYTHITSQDWRCYVTFPILPLSVSLNPVTTVASCFMYNLCNTTIKAYMPTIHILCDSPSNMITCSMPCKAQ